MPRASKKPVKEMTEEERLTEEVKKTDWLEILRSGTPKEMPTTGGFNPCKLDGKCPQCRPIKGGIRLMASPVRVIL